jgi:hypothetical protein
MQVVAIIFFLLVSYSLALGTAGVLLGAFIRVISRIR